jgi:hypothetical protein
MAWRLPEQQSNYLLSTKTITSDVEEGVGEHVECQLNSIRDTPAASASSETLHMYQFTTLRSSFSGLSKSCHITLLIYVRSKM